MEPCTETPVELKVNGDLARAIRSLRKDIKRCDVNVSAMNRWLYGVNTR